MKDKDIIVPPPALQKEFFTRLTELRKTSLQEALFCTVGTFPMDLIDKELSEHVSQKYLQMLAQRGLRGELLFPVPCLLEKNPFLLGYYRLLLGFSQKEFYGSDNGLSSFKTMETKGLLKEEKINRLPQLCKALIGSAVVLAEAIGKGGMGAAVLHELTLLTLGSQLRGGS